MAVGDQVAALAAAGNDVEALEQAIKAASHLDEKPGDDRQKLRGEAVWFVNLSRSRRCMRLHAL